MPPISKKLLIKKKEKAEDKANRLLVQTKREIKTPTNDVNVKEIAKANQSVFRRSLKRLRKLSADEDFDESINKETLKSIREMLLDLVPLAEENYRQYRVDRSAYALNVLINQIREVQADERALEDFQNRSDKIKEMFKNHYLMVIQNLLDEAMKLNSHLVSALDLNTDAVEKEKIRLIMKDFVKDHSYFIKEASQSINAQLDDYIVRKPGQNRIKMIGRS